MLNEMRGDKINIGFLEFPKVSVIMPAYNEEGKISKTLIHLEKTLKETGLNYEVIVVNDGSSDETENEVKKYARGNNHIKVISYNRNMGKGFAVKIGFKKSMGDYVLLLDSDMDIHPSQVKAYIDALKNADVAIGSKWHPESEVEISIPRKLLSRVFQIMVKILFGFKIKDTQVGLKAFRREALRKLTKVQLVKRYAFDVELLAVANMLRLKIAELPVKLKLTDRFKFREIMHILVDLMGIYYRFKVIKWYQRQLEKRIE